VQTPQSASQKTFNKVQSLAAKQQSNYSRDMNSRLSHFRTFDNGKTPITEMTREFDFGARKISTSNRPKPQTRNLSQTAANIKNQ